MRTVQQPQQSISQALSEYAPGRLIVIDRKTYRSGGVFSNALKGELNRARKLFNNPKSLFIAISALLSAILIIIRIAKILVRSVVAF